MKVTSHFQLLWNTGYIFHVLLLAIFPCILYPVVYASHSFTPTCPSHPSPITTSLFYLWTNYLLFCYTLAMVLKWTLGPDEGRQPRANPMCPSKWRHQEGARVLHWREHAFFRRLRSRRSTACSLVRKGRPRPPRPLPGILSMQVRGVTCSECRWASLFGRGMLILGRGLESKALAVKMDHFNEVPWDLPRSAFPGTPTCVLVSREGISVLTAPLTLACLLCGDGVAPRDREGRKLLYLLLLPDSFHHV